MSSAEPNSTAAPVAPARTVGAWLLPLLSVALVVAGPVVQILAIDTPFIARTALFMWIFSTAAAAVGLIAIVKFRGWAGRGVSGLGVALSMTLMGLLAFGMNLPASTRPDLVIAPDFTLPDHTGKPVSLAELRSDRGAVLVFYRGFW